MTKDQYKKQLVKELTNDYGTLISGNSLCHLLGFPSMAAFRKGIERGTIEVPILTFDNRRGKFALTKDIAEWLTNNRFKALEDVDVK